MASSKKEDLVPQTSPSTQRRPIGPPPAAPSDVLLRQVEYSFSGPLPPAQELQAYEQALPGAAERIFQMREAEIKLTEAQVNHRMGLENKVIDSDVRNSRIGVWSANVWLFAGLGMTTLFVMTGHDTAGEIIGPAVIGSILTAFLSNTYNRRKERIEKTKLLTGKASEGGNTTLTPSDAASGRKKRD
jgi:uncharacterized membrane protein